MEEGLALFALALLFAAALGLAAVAAQHLVLWNHVRQAPRVPRRGRPVSILKPLCGLDDGLAGNLASFAALDHGRYEVLLGLRDAADPAAPIARAAAACWPDRFRVVLQRGEPGLNPKVNQLVGLARAARHDLLVVSDSNVRVGPGYLAEIDALLEDEAVGLVTHPIAGDGETTLGSLFDHLHLAGSITPAIVGARRLVGRDVVVGKSMALRRGDLERLGGFQAVSGVLAEDEVLGRLVVEALGKRVAVARTPIAQLGTRRSLGAFAARYRRWGVLQRQTVGPVLYAAQLLLNPVLVAAIAVAAAPGARTFVALAAVALAKAALDGLAGLALRPGGFGVAKLALVPVKDLLFGAAWAYALVRRDVEWRGTRILVGAGTRIEAPASGGGAELGPGR
ncbi:MAG TPA: glycosyltransferase, partial [Anaeromyxobacteraceae bacterium]|nr:glycosyltransferase [Anaeromyxobacteraceae bacterium]